jgi:hypothetical protein
VNSLRHAAPAQVDPEQPVVVLFALFVVHHVPVARLSP